MKSEKKPFTRKCMKVRQTGSEGPSPEPKMMRFTNTSVDDDANHANEYAHANSITADRLARRAEAAFEQAAQIMPNPKRIPAIYERDDKFPNLVDDDIVNGVPLTANTRRGFKRLPLLGGG